MVWKLVGLAALVTMPHMQPPSAGAQTVAAEIHGGLHVQTDNRCDVTGDWIDDAGTSTVYFWDVTLNGVFTTPEDGYIGAAHTWGFAACVGPAEPCLNRTTGTCVPLQRRGIVRGADFETGIGIGRAINGRPACLFGHITGGKLALTAGTAEAILDLTWDVFTPDPNCAAVDPDGDTPIGHAEARDVVAEFVTIPELSSVGLVGQIAPPSAVQVDHDAAPCTRELLIDPFFEIRMSPFGSPETSLCIVVKFPIHAGLRVALSPVSAPLIPAPSP